MRYHTVSIKGSLSQAIVAANEYGIILHNPSKHPRFNEIIAYVDEECLPELRQWFCEPCDFEAREAEPGTLLWYSGVSVLEFYDDDDIRTASLAGTLEALHAQDVALIRGLTVTVR